MHPGRLPYAALTYLGVTTGGPHVPAPPIVSKALTTPRTCWAEVFGAFSRRSIRSGTTCGVARTLVEPLSALPGGIVEAVELAAMLEPPPPHPAKPAPRSAVAVRTRPAALARAPTEAHRG